MSGAHSSPDILRYVIVGTWNLDAKWSSGHAELIATLNCDVCC